MLTYLIAPTIAQFNPTRVKLTFAQDNPILLTQQVNCLNPQTTTQMNQCSSQEAQATDQKLNQVYQLLIAEVSGKQKQRLLAAQVAWIDFRDKTCEYEKGQFEGGTLAPSTYSYCLARVTQQRVSDLETYLEKARL
ncbi:MAG: lysozyme inhibitor LprI family protein [Xenococcaceae cyanobacterium]